MKRKLFCLFLISLPVSIPLTAMAANGHYQLVMFIILGIVFGLVLPGIGIIWFLHLMGEL